MSPVRCALAAVLVALAGCAGADGSPDATPVSSTISAIAPAVTAGGTTVPPAASPTATPATTAPPAPVYRAEVVSIDAAIATRMRRSWRPGCPVGLDDLRLVRLVHWGADGAVHDGELVVHRDVADAVAVAFGEIFAARFPVTSVRLVDEFDADDQASMRADNTSGFNCREVAGRPGVWSEHAFGRAVDVNPLRNPWVRGPVVDPPEGARWADRTLGEPGMLGPDSAPVRAFRAIGWGWGGDWSGGQDWQHFSASGR